MDYSTITTPAGPFSIVIDEDANVLASGFTSDLSQLRGLRGCADGTWRERADLGGITKAVHRYFEGELPAIDEVDVLQRGSEFLMTAWKTLRTVKTPVSYAEFAVLSGRPAAVRAVAQACARNTTALFVPCHRVLRSNGSLGGFRWGIPVKKFLLQHEATAG